MLKVFIMIGISGSGKSTYADRLYAKMTTLEDPVQLIRTDDIRAELCGDANDQSKNKDVWRTAHERLQLALQGGLSVIFDATNLNIEDRAPILKIAKKYNATPVGIVMHTPLQVSIDRNKSRTRVVPTPVIWRQYNKFKIPQREEIAVVEHVGLFPKDK